MFLQMFWRPDVVMTVAPAFVCAPAGWLVAKLTGAKAWLHLQDFEVDVAFQMGMLKGQRLKNLVLGMERWMLKRFDVVSSISGRMLQRLRDKGVSNENIRLFPNWVDIDHVKTSAKPSDYREQLNIAPDAKVSLFSGTLGAKQGLMVIPDAAHRLAHRTDIVFVVCGEGAMKSQLVEAAKTLPNLLLLPLQPFERLGELLGLADVHLLTQSEDVEDLVLPSKLTGMLASGRAIIATCREGTEIAAVVSQCGIVVPPAHGEALAAAIERLADDRDQRDTMGTNARAYSETNLSREKVLGNLLAQLETITWAGPAELSEQYKG
jgi:colanic acid biosynthesis glycosyl transferase WcaI